MSLQDIWEGTQTFVITALLPVVESFGFADELRKATSGAATSPQLAFSHWEVLDDDPFARVAEDAASADVAASRQSLARRYVDTVRSRKGLPVERKTVVHAEKQRTLKR